MPSKTLIATATIATVLSGCASYGNPPPAGAAPGASTPPPPPPVTAVCNAQPAQGAIGQSSTPSVVETARARSGALMARVLRPGQMVTKEFNAQRLNLEVDASGRIVAVSCG
ncbi:I78 family peptidase inhibitor [Paracidovorax sp. MALMAid1276]|uniref:I78 family peptidase inhibitor n=1 Tax=Paracidovorax sp. MALMAid1276 TaxID=3411631 RepID=UPI003B998583